MDFLDNVVKSSNALIKETTQKLNNPFGNKQSSKQEDDQPITQQANLSATTSESSNQGNNANLASTSSQGQAPPDQSSEDKGEDEEGRNGDKNSRFAAMAADAEAVTQNAVKGAKNIGSFLFSMANKAGQTVTQTAKQVKQAVESTSILTDLTREQQEFIKYHGGNLQTGELPWEQCNDQAKAAEIKEQILTLSQDKRNFVRSPPNDADFKFDPQQHYPIALSLLKEDPNLSKIRFELVPKLVNEETFWRNYFYRVSLLKQMSARGDDIKRQGFASSRSSSGEGPDEVSVVNEELSQVGEASPNSMTATKQHGFNQDSKATNIAPATSAGIQQTQVINTDFMADLESSESRKLVAEADDLKSKLRELNIGSLDLGDQDEDDKWEEELQKDLQEFELVSGDVSALEEESLEDDIKELENSTRRDAS